MISARKFNSGGGEPIPKDDAFPVQPCKQKNAVRLKGVKGSGKRGLGGENPGG